MSLFGRFFEKKVSIWLTSQANGMHFLNESVSEKSSNANLKKIKDLI
jgi:hypothetical protein